MPRQIGVPHVPILGHGKTRGVGASQKVSNIDHFQGIAHSFSGIYSALFIAAALPLIQLS
jgi:hypothetical protein